MAADKTPPGAAKTPKWAELRTRTRGSWVWLPPTAAGSGAVAVPWPSTRAPDGASNPCFAQFAAAGRRPVSTVPTVRGAAGAVVGAGWAAPRLTREVHRHTGPTGPSFPTQVCPGWWGGGGGGTTRSLPVPCAHHAWFRTPLTAGRLTERRVRAEPGVGCFRASSAASILCQTTRRSSRTYTSAREHTPAHTCTHNPIRTHAPMRARSTSRCRSGTHS